MTPAETLLCAILRGEAPPWPAAADAVFADRFLVASAQHGVAPLIGFLLSPTPAWAAWPAKVCHALQRQTRLQSAWELLARDELAAVLDTLTGHGLQPLLMKGAALAYSHYPAPFLRPRTDADVLIRTADFPAAAAALTTLGYQRIDCPALSPAAAQLVSYQCAFRRPGPRNLSHVLDVHWRLNNAPAFAHALTHEELAAQAVALPALGANGRALGPAHALLLAGLHLASHADSPGETARLLWLYDIVLLTRTLTPAQWTDVTTLARARGLARACRESLAAAEAVGPRVPADALAALTVAETGAPRPLGRRLALRWRYLREVLATRPGGCQQAALVWEYLFPAPAYIRAKYPDQSRWRLPLGYCHRLGEGLWKAFR